VDFEPLPNLPRLLRLVLHVASVKADGVDFRLVRSAVRGGRMLSWASLGWRLSERHKHSVY
jgi:hypothetical protein